MKRKTKIKFLAIGIVATLVMAVFFLVGAAEPVLAEGNGDDNVTYPEGGVTNNCDYSSYGNCDGVAEDFFENLHRPRIISVVEGTYFENLDQFLKNPDSDDISSSPDLTSGTCEFTSSIAHGYDEIALSLAAFALFEYESIDYETFHIHVIDDKHVAFMFDATAYIITKVPIGNIPPGTTGTAHFVSNEVIEKKAGTWKVVVRAGHSTISFDL